MKNNYRENKFGGRKSGGSFQGKSSWNRDFGGDRNADERPSMHKATCVECGNVCEVPFKPNGSKPVYCSNCFRRDERGAPPRYAGTDNGRSSFGEKKLYRAICDSCQNPCEVPFRPTGEKPVYCRECFGGQAKTPRTERGSEKGNDGMKQQLNALQVKVDAILKILQEATSQGMEELHEENEVIENIKEEEAPKKSKKKTDKKATNKKAGKKKK